MPTRNNDNTPIVQYIRALENPDSLGFRNGKWYASPYDKNARGFGVDIVKNKQASKVASGRVGGWLTEDEERNLRNQYIESLQNTIDYHYHPYLRNQELSDTKRMIATGLLYRGDGISSNKNLSEPYYSGTDEEFQQAVYDYYESKNLKERAKNHFKFVKNSSNSETTQELEEKYKGKYNPKEVQIVGEQPTPTPTKLTNLVEQRRKEINTFLNTRKYSKGGSLEVPKFWDSLSMPEKAEMMKVAIRNGITTLPEIRKAYNEFAEGGNLFAEGSYMEQAKSLIRKNEGWSAKPYKDAPTGRTWRSVGYGFNDSGFRDKYPEGISKHYEHGITRAQAEEELNHYLYKAERTLKGIYGKQWNAFTDGQKAAILDTYYQRPASVGNDSAFYKAVRAGKDATNYLGVNGYEKRNKGRREAFSGAREIPVTMENMDAVMNSPVTVQESIDFMPLNPQVFGIQMPSFQASETITEQPIVEMAQQQVPTPEQLEMERVLQERQERRDRLDKFNLLMSLSSPRQDNSMLGAIGMLSGFGTTNAYGESDNIFDK